MSKERRKAENIALRELVDALKNFIDARDGLWSLNIFDRMFRPNRYRSTLKLYDAAQNAVRSAVRDVMDATAHTPREEPPSAPASSQDAEAPSPPPPLISMEEFEFLLRGPHSPPPKRLGSGKKYPSPTGWE